MCESSRKKFKVLSFQVALIAPLTTAQTTTAARKMNFILVFPQNQLKFYFILTAETTTALTADFFALDTLIQLNDTIITVLPDYLEVKYKLEVLINAYSEALNLPTSTISEKFK